MLLCKSIWRGEGKMRFFGPAVLRAIVPITGCTDLAVGPTLTTATCTGLNAFPVGACLTGVVSSITGTTSDAAAQLNIVWGG